MANGTWVPVVDELLKRGCSLYEVAFCHPGWPSEFQERSGRAVEFCAGSGDPDLEMAVEKGRGTRRLCR
jgi:hypothetical protein